MTARAPSHPLHNSDFQELRLLSSQALALMAEQDAAYAALDRAEDALVRFKLAVTIRSLSQSLRAKLARQAELIERLSRIHFSPATGGAPSSLGAASLRRRPDVAPHRAGPPRVPTKTRILRDGDKLGPAASFEPGRAEATFAISRTVPPQAGVSPDAHQRAGRNPVSKSASLGATTLAREIEQQ